VRVAQEWSIGSLYVVQKGPDIWRMIWGGSEVVQLSEDDLKVVLGGSEWF
jgi:hypothetical protein